MRTLVLLRGAPGCGKSTFIETQGFKPYTLSADELRILFESPTPTINGEIGISQKNDKQVWKLLFELLENRMKNGEFTVIDATNSKNSEMCKYKGLAEKYKYRIFLIDFTNVPIEICKHRNASREYKKVPETVIDTMYSRFKTERVPSSFTVLSPNEIYKVFYPIKDLNQYKKIIHIGDIHGCYTVLNEYLKNGLNEDYFYIFLGDYLDRGIENVQVIKFLLSIYNNSNVLMLEGNHEKWLYCYAYNEISQSKEFEFITRKQLFQAEIDTKEIKKFYRKLAQCAYYTYDNKEVFCCHGGISRFRYDNGQALNCSLICTNNLIKGTGDYSDYLETAKSWEKHSRNNQYQIFGHRNTENSEIQLTPRVFDLEGHVEFGGDLRILELDKNGFTPIKIKNTVYREKSDFELKTEIIRNPISELVLKMRSNKFIREKHFGNISSFNFTRDAFRYKEWNDQTVKARGLFIDLENMKIICRGYEKFFNIDEMPFSTLNAIKKTLKFPVNFFIKENGFLGLVSYDERNDSLLYASKSMLNEGEHCQYIKDVLNEMYSQEQLNFIKNYCKDNNTTFAFEIIDIVNDPHIIEYEKSTTFLLSIIKNDINFKQLPYQEMVELCKPYNILTKKLYATVFDIVEFEKIFTDANKLQNYTEGLVIEDAYGFMVKYKLPYYKFWKYMRTITSEVASKGKSNRTGSLKNQLAWDFYSFIKDENVLSENWNIIDLRKKFFEKYSYDNIEKFYI